MSILSMSYSNGAVEIAHASILVEKAAPRETVIQSPDASESETF